MLHITDIHYRALAEKLLSAIAGATFYNGTIEISDNGYDAYFRATLIIRHTTALDPTDRSQSATVITDITPVWWEYHLYNALEEVLTDFDWREMKKFLT